MEIVDENSEPLIQGTRGRKPMYPWNEWLRHNVTVRITEGIDFNCKPNSIRQQAFNQATNRHGTIATRGGVDVSGRATLEITFSFSAAYLKAQDKIRIEGDIAMGIHEPIRTGVIPLEDKDDDTDLDYLIKPSRQRELEDQLIDNPVARQGQKWGPPAS